MEWIGWVCLMILIFYSSYPEKVRKLERELASMKRKLNGDAEMSKLLAELAGKRCKITNEDGSQNAWVYDILAVDGDWVKVRYTDKKEKNKVELIRIADIKKLTLIAE